MVQCKGRYFLIGVTQDGIRIILISVSLGFVATIARSLLLNTLISNELDKDSIFFFFLNLCGITFGQGKETKKEQEAMCIVEALCVTVGNWKGLQHNILLESGNTMAHTGNAKNLFTCMNIN